MANLGNKRYVTDATAAVKDRLIRDRALNVWQNTELKMVSRPGEPQNDFLTRCTLAADTGADTEADKIREKLAAKIDKVKDALDTAELRAQQLEQEQSSNRTSELLNVGGSVLGALLGGRKSVRSITGAVGRAANSRTRTQRAGNRTEAALAKVEEKAATLEDLENELTEELAEIQEKWDSIAGDITQFSIPIDKTDITVEEAIVIWVPTA